LALDTGGVVADVGAGEGFYTRRLAPLVGPEGRVYAVDIAPGALASLRRIAQTIEPRNVVVVEGRVDNPRLPHDSLDAVLIVNAYHEMAEHDAMLAHLFAALKPGGRLVLLEPFDRTRSLPTREAQRRAHLLASGEALSDLERAGFEVLRHHEEWAQAPGSRRVYWMIVARRPPPVGRPRRRAGSAFHPACGAPRPLRR
jgi:ubiquinone/menaquinone biosynthesis C-methylase UbiE